MDSSPPFSSSSPRSISPLLDEDELLASASPLPSPVPSVAPSLSSTAHDLYTTPNSTDNKVEADTKHNDFPPVCPDPPLRDAGSRLIKGKEKARLSPLRLLDLPVDILKEIIQQVSISPPKRRLSRLARIQLGAPFNHLLTAASTYQRSYISRSLPFRPPPAHHTIYILSLRYRLA